MCIIDPLGSAQVLLVIQGGSEKIFQVRIGSRAQVYARLAKMTILL